MPLKDKDISEDQKQQNAVDLAYLEKQFEENDVELDENNFKKDDFKRHSDANLNSFLAKKDSERNAKESYKKVIIDNLSRMNSSRDKFQTRLQQTQKAQLELVAK